MDCQQCGTPNMALAKYCRRCGQALPQRQAWVLGAVNSHRRRVKAGNLRDGELVRAEAWWLDDVFLNDVHRAFLEAARHLDPDATMKLVDGEGKRCSLVLEGAGVMARFKVNWPYTRLELRGDRAAIREVVRRVVARHGEDLFAVRDGDWERFLKYTGVDQAENKTTLLDLLG